MAAFLLAIIYAIFLGIGLPNSILGSAWPVMQNELNVPFSSAGIISMIITSGMVVSSFLSGSFIRRFDTGKIAFISVIILSASLSGFGALPSFIWLAISAIPFGLATGIIDASLNNFMTLHYKSTHMNWLHCFWGIGATLGPIIMSLCIERNHSWRLGYYIISIILCCLAVILFLTLSFWKKFGRKIETVESDAMPPDIRSLLRIPGVKISLLSFFSYCSFQVTVSLWGSSYLVINNNLAPDIAARWISIFFIGITVGRFVSGFAALKISNIILIRIGLLITAAGTVILLLPLPEVFSMAGLIVIGLGCSPVFPCMIKETPFRFGEAASQSIIGFQMAFAYIGGTCMPTIFGVIVSKNRIGFFPIFILLCIIIMAACTEAIKKITRSSCVKNAV